MAIASQCRTDRVSVSLSAEQTEWVFVLKLIDWSQGLVGMKNIRAKKSDTPKAADKIKPGDLEYKDIGASNSSL